MKILLILLFLISILLLYTMCSSRTERELSNKATIAEQEGASTLEEDTSPPNLEYAALGCFGKCPEFRLKVFENGKLTYEGIKNIEHIGLHMTLIEESLILPLARKAKAIGFEQLREEYLLQIPDMAQFEISYAGKTVKFHRRNAPEELLEIKKELDGLISRSKWEKVHK